MTTEKAVATDEQCAKDHALWKEESEKWKKEHERALSTLEDTAAFILKHEAELDDHLRDIEAHEQMHGSQGAEPEKLRERHCKVKERHNRLRGRHRGLIEEILRLQVTLHKAAHGSIY